MALARMTLARSEIEAFCRAKETHRMEARQMVALFLICGIDLSSALQAPDAERRELRRRLRRLVERERLKGTRGHWSYDLNRHIALSQALQRLSRAPAPVPNKKAAPKGAANRS